MPFLITVHPRQALHRLHHEIVGTDVVQLEAIASASRSKHVALKP